MKKTETIKLIGILTAAYPKMEVNEAAVEIWHECLKDLDTSEALTAVKRHIMESVFPPTVADIRRKTVPQLIDSGTAWGEVMRAIKLHGYYNEGAAYGSMSALTAETVRSMGWREICHSENISVVRGQFLKIYDSLSKRANEVALLPAEMRPQLEGRACINGAVDE